MPNKSNIGRRYGHLVSLPDQRDYHLEDHLEIKKKQDRIDVLQASKPDHIDQLQVGCCGGCGFSRWLKTLMNFRKYKYDFMPSALAAYFYARVNFGGAKPTEDSGVAIPDLMKAANKFGVIPEDSNHDWSWPFSASDDRWTIQPPKPAEKDGLNHTIAKWMRVPYDEAHIDSALAAGMPLLIGMSIYESFETDAVANDGMVPMPKPREELMGGHCVYVWGKGVKKAGYYDLANSWGDKWGDKGDFHLPVEYLTNPNLVSDLFTGDLIT